MLELELTTPPLVRVARVEDVEEDTACDDGKEVEARVSVVLLGITCL